jgi:hypothetical protein
MLMAIVWQANACFPHGSTTNMCQYLIFEVAQASVTYTVGHACARRDARPRLVHVLREMFSGLSVRTLFRSKSRMDKACNKIEMDFQMMLRSPLCTTPARSIGVGWSPESIVQRMGRRPESIAHSRVTKLLD